LYHYNYTKENYVMEFRMVENV